MKIQSQFQQFGDYPAKLHVRFEPKRNLIKLLGGVVRSTVAANELR
ncbi:MAG: hypothetical protein JNM32_05240 [Dechloromonas sp.]|nr:hypothetical protein [Dechloromonas sp.]